MKKALIIAFISTLTAACSFSGQNMRPQASSVHDENSTQVGNQLEKYQASQLDNPAPLVSPAGEPVFDHASESLKNTQSDVESIVRKSLSDSTIDNLKIELKTAKTLVGNEQITASRQLT